MRSFQAAESSRERKKKISTNAQALRFEKSLELAQRQLKETNNLANAEHRQEQVRTAELTTRQYSLGCSTH